MVPPEQFYYHDSGKIKFYASSSISSYEHPNEKLGTWYHIVFVSDGTTVTAYENGTLIYNKPDGGNGSHKPLTRIYIGRLSNHNGLYFNGSMSDFRYYDDVLSPEQISLLYSNGPGEAVPLIPKIPATIQLQEKTSSKIKCLIEGDPTSIYRMEVAGQSVENIKTGDTVDIDGLEGNTEYTLNLY